MTKSTLLFGLGSTGLPCGVSGRVRWIQTIEEEGGIEWSEGTLWVGKERLRVVLDLWVTLDNLCISFSGSLHCRALVLIPFRPRSLSALLLE